MFYRKEGFKNFGLNTRNLFSTLLQSVLIAFPLIIFLALNHQINSYFPLQSVNLTKEVMKQSFPSNIWTYSFIGLIWGFWERFNYTMLSLLKRYTYVSHLPYSWFDSGATTYAIFCLLIHGIFGIDIYYLFEGLTIFVFIYSMIPIQQMLLMKVIQVIMFSYFRMLIPDKSYSTTSKASDSS